MNERKLINLEELIKDQRFIVSLSRGLTVLSCFTEATEALSHQQICEKTGLAKATITRIIFTLISMNYLIQDSTGKYLLGREAILLSNTAFSQYDSLKLIKPLMSEFAEKYKVSVNLGVHQAGMITYVIAHRSPSRISVNLKTGSQVPLEQTAIGRALYAKSSEQKKQVILEYISKRQDIDIISIKQKLDQHCKFYEDNNYAISNGDYSSEILAIAVAIQSQKNNDNLYSLNASVPSSLWNEKEYIQHISEPLNKLALQISATV